MKKNLSLTAGLLALVSLTAGCGEGETASSSVDEVVEINMGVSRIADLAPLYLGEEQGFFEDEGIDLNLQPQQGGSVTITGVVSGDFQMGFANTVSFLLATSKGIPLRAVAPAANVGSDPQSEDFTAIMVRADSPIQSVADLAGRTIAVNTVESMVDTMVRASLDAEGVDSSTVEFVEIPFQDQIAALETGRVDVITPQEPFLYDAQQQGLKTVLPGYYATAIPGFTNGFYFTSEAFLQENPEVIEGFQRAIERSVEYANSHEDEVRAVIPSFTGVDPGVAENIALPSWEPAVNRGTTEQLSDLLVDFGLIEQRPDLDELLPSPN
jgi:NitT/TauT family transport system substrate-binding protein